MDADTGPIPTVVALCYHRARTLSVSSAERSGAVHAGRGAHAHNDIFHTSKRRDTDDGPATQGGADAKG